MRPSASLALLALGAALLAIGIALSFWAGCTGDLKGGALGDPIAALRIQGFAAIAALSATASLIAAAATLIPVRVQDEAKYGMLLPIVNDWGKSWRDRDCWT